MALANLAPLFATVFEETAGLEPGEVTPTRLRRIRDALGKSVKVRLRTDAAGNGPAWARLSSLSSAQLRPGDVEPTVSGIFLYCARQPWRDMSDAAREANGLLLEFGATPAAPWRYASVPPASLRYVTEVSQLPDEDDVAEVVRAEDATRVTVTRAAADLSSHGLLITTASAHDASAVSFFQGARLGDAFDKILRRNAAAVGAEPDLLIEDGYSYTFMIRTKALQPLETGEDRCWLVQRVDNSTLELERDPARVWPRMPEPPFDGQELEEMRGGRLLAIAKRRTHGARGEEPRPLHGFIIITHQGANKFVEGPTHRDLRETLYEPDPMDREIGPEARLKFRALRAWLSNSPIKMEKFFRYFPTVAIEQQTRFACVTIVACEYLLAKRASPGATEQEIANATQRGVAEMFAPEVSRENALAGLKLGKYMWNTKVSTNPELKAQLAPTSQLRRSMVDCFVRQYAHLDAYARVLVDGMEDLPE